MMGVLALYNKFLIMTSNRLSGYLLTLVVIAVTDSCNKAPSPNFNCRPTIYVDGELEDFCVEPTDIITSELIVSDDQFLAYQYADSIEFARSPNFESYLIAYTAIKPAGVSLDNEIAFLQELQIIFKPGSLHRFNLDTIGGFAIELFARDGEYFSTEYSKAKNSAMFEVSSSSIYLLGPNSDRDPRIASQFIINVEPIGTILLANESGTIEHRIEFEHSNVSISFNFSMFR